VNREEIIHSLEQASPVITQVTFTSDMGYEFSAIVPGGVIYPIPGMLLGHSGGEWPPNLWDCKTEEEYIKSLRGFLLDQAWLVTPWDALSDDEIEDWWDAVRLQNEDKKDS
jgi:hypothetical protein